VSGRRGLAAAHRAVAWLRKNQNSDGGFGARSGQSSNAQSTSYAVQGVLAVGARGAVVSRALAYLVRLQTSSGSVRYSRSSSQTPVWVTAQALMALKRKPLPIAPPRRRRRAGRKAVAAAPAHRTRKRTARRRHAAHAKRATAAAPQPARARRPAPRVGSARRSKVAPVASSGDGPPPLLLAGAAAAALALVLLSRRLLRRRLRG
jgi:hypothetical protein